ncbi:peptidase M54 [Anaeromyxobacter oryzisoli]|uniref:peptidase M54 n=1 Tax=Anaeromyxobacter oryzisoli TaxID=2925408 RepID=UPI001F57BD39|nr:peptidase M54 [Anaeromyxobacter sp. SG63]
MKILQRPAQVAVVGLGDLPPGVLAGMRHAIAEALGVAARGGPALDRPLYAYNAARGQYHTPAILRRLASLRAGAGGAPVVGITAVDLFLPETRYVLGDADRDAGAAVISICRLAAADPEALGRRARVEAIHAAGQLLGLSHCGDHRCAMYLAEEAVDCDRKGPGLCGSCRAALGLP